MSQAKHFMDDMNSQLFSLSHCHNEALSGLQHGLLSYIVFPIPVYITSQRCLIANVLFITETMNAAIHRHMYQQKLWTPSVNV